MLIKAPAKINLHLRVGPPRADGFHPLLTWMCTVDLCDEIHIQSRREPGISLSCSDPTLPTDSRNLVFRAAELLRRADEGIQIQLEKQIPDGAGLGGGSSDAAATLKALAKMWNRNENLAGLASQIGSDVPFFLQGPSAVCEGRGERVTPIGLPKPKHAVLFLPQIKMPTPAVYKKLDEMRQFGDTSNSVNWAQWSQLSALDLLPKLVNDLEPPAFAINPELGALKERIEKRLNRIVRMSGSGSSLFTLFDDKEEADAAAKSAAAGCGVRAIAAQLGG